MAVIIYCKTSFAVADYFNTNTLVREIGFNAQLRLFHLHEKECFQPKVGHRTDFCSIYFWNLNEKKRISVTAKSYSQGVEMSNPVKFFSIYLEAVQSGMEEENRKPPNFYK